MNKNVSTWMVYLGGTILVALLLAGYLRNLNQAETNSQVNSNEPIKVGALYSLTGAVSDIGEAMRRGSEIAVAEINDNGGINGQPLEVLY